jgi:hypothetical protein
MGQLVQMALMANGLVLKTPISFEYCADGLAGLAQGLCASRRLTKTKKTRSRRFFWFYGTAHGYLCG